MPGNGKRQGKLAHADGPPLRGILVGEANNFREKVVLAKVIRARFTRDVLAGAELIYEADMLHLRPEGASVAARALVDGELIGATNVFRECCAGPLLPRGDCGCVVVLKLRGRDSPARGCTRATGPPWRCR